MGAPKVPIGLAIGPWPIEVATSDIGGMPDPQTSANRLLVLGAGTAGTMVVNKLRPLLGDDWILTIVDHQTEHHYQPGYLFVPFGTYQPGQVTKPKAKFIPGRRGIGDGSDQRSCPRRPSRSSL